MTQKGKAKTHLTGLGFLLNNEFYKPCEQLCDVYLSVCNNVMYACLLCMYLCYVCYVQTFRGGLGRWTDAAGYTDI